MTTWMCCVPGRCLLISGYGSVCFFMCYITLYLVEKLLYGLSRGGVARSGDVGNVPQNDYLSIK